MVQHKNQTSALFLGDMPPPARGCLPNGRRGSPVQSARLILVKEQLLLAVGCGVEEEFVHLLLVDE